MVLSAVFAIAHHHHAGHGFALAVFLGDAALHVRADADFGNIRKQHRRAFIGRGEHDVLQVFRIVDITPPPHHVFGLGNLDHPAADIVVGVFNRGDHFFQRHFVKQQSAGIDFDLVLPHRAADGSHFRHAFHAGELIANVPILNCPQFAKIVFVFRVFQRVDVDPTRGGGVRTEPGRDFFRQLALHLVQVFQHATPRPIHIGSILEDHVDEREPEETIAANIRHVGNRKHRGRQRISDLVFNRLRIAALPRRVDDNLHVRQIGNGINRNRIGRPSTDHRNQHREDADQKPIIDAPSDELTNHGFSISKRLPQLSILWPM